MSPRLIYIMGTGRSGSTVFEILLSGAEGVFGAGELSFIIQDGFLQNQPCSCGARALDCEVWSKVLQTTGWGNAELVDLAKLFRSVDHHRRVPGLLFGEDVPKAYLEANNILLSAISEVTGSRVIVDSSKYVARALALSRSDVELDVVRLVRNPKGLMRSWQRPNKGEQPPKSPLQMLAYYSYVGASLWSASRGLPAAVSLTYEDLVAAPQDTLESTARALRLDLATTLDAVAEKKPIAVGHIVTGNRLRKRGEIVFESRHAAEEPKGVRARLAVSAMELERRLFRL